MANTELHLNLESVYPAANRIEGDVTLAPVREAGQAWRLNRPEGVALMVPEDVAGRIVAGRLVDLDGDAGVVVFAAGVGAFPERIAWRITFDRLEIDGELTYLAPFAVWATPGEPVDLAVAAPVADADNLRELWGRDGVDGQDGADGRGIVSIDDDDGDGVATITYSDGTTSSLPLPTAPAAAPEPEGPTPPAELIQVYDYNPYADPENALYGQGVGADGQWMAAGDDYNPYADRGSPYYNTGDQSGYGAMGPLYLAWPEGLSAEGRTAYHGDVDWRDGWQ